MLILLSVTMFVGSFVSGLIPLTLSLSESKMRFITIIGAGLLVGTALAVIIPEGVHTLYKNNNEHGVHKRDTLSSSLSSSTSQAVLNDIAINNDKIKRHVVIYFSIVRRRACCASLVNLSTSVKTTT